MAKRNRKSVGAALLIAALGAAWPVMAESCDTGICTLTSFGQLRYRYEYVGQDGLPEDAYASTARINAGIKTGKINGFQGLAELQAIKRIGPEHFNDSMNSKTTYPVVADPDNAEINQFWLSWAGIPDLEVKAGRQKVNWDNQRFIGAADWRQNDQTFDSLSLGYANGPVILQYGYIWNVNRVFGGDHVLGDIDSNSHAARLQYSYAPWLTATAYTYMFDFDNWPVRSSHSFGLRLTGTAQPAPGWTLSYEAEAARQINAYNNPADYSEPYYLLSLGLDKKEGVGMQAYYEMLGGDGVSAFQTPLASLHKFNGWADKFLDTPANGLADLYLGVSYNLPKSSGMVDGVSLVGGWHRYSAHKTADTYGEEFDLSLKKTFEGPEFANGIDWTLTYANYDADALYADTKKAWLQITVNF